MKSIKEFGKGMLQFIFCLVVASGIIWLLNHFYQKYKSGKQLQKAVAHYLHDSTKHYKDLYNREHATRLLVEADAATAKLLYEDVLDSVAKAVRTKKSSIGSVTAISSQTVGNITTILHDTVYQDRPASRISYRDKWLWIDGIVIDSQAAILYEIYDSIIIATHRKRKNIFAHKETYIDVYSLNPHTRVNTITAFRIDNSKPKRWGIGPCAGYGWNGSALTPFIGLSVQYSLIRL